MLILSSPRRVKMLSKHTLTAESQSFELETLFLFAISDMAQCIAFS